MAPIKPSVAAGASVPSVPSTPSAKGKGSKNKKAVDLAKIQGKAEQALRNLRLIHKYATAWQVANDLAPIGVQLGKIVGATEAKALNRLVEMEQTLQALVEVKWFPPAVKVAADGERAFEKDDRVSFRDGAGKKMVARGIATKEEIADLTVIRVTAGKTGAWVTAISAKTQNHYGPLPAYNFKHL